MQPAAQRHLAKGLPGHLYPLPGLGFRGRPAQFMADLLAPGGDSFLQQGEQGGVLLEANHRGGGGLVVAGLQLREMAPPQLVQQVFEHLDPHALHPQRGQQGGDVPGQRAAEDDHQHGAGLEAFGVPVGQIGDAVQGDGGLARPGPAVDHHHARIGPGNQVELRWIDQPGDGGEPLVGAPQGGGVLAQRRQGAGPQRRPLAPGKSGPLLHRFAPRAGIQHEYPLGTDDAHQPPLEDHHPPMGQDASFHHSPADGFLVLVVFAVKVEDLADGGVTPVDDGIGQLAAGQGAVADQQLARAAVLVNAQMAEIGRFRVQRGFHPVLAAVMAGQGGQVGHLLHDLGDLVLRGLAQGIAQLQQRLVVIHVPPGWHVAGEVRPQPLEDAHLLGYDGAGIRGKRIGETNGSGFGRIVRIVCVVRVVQRSSSGAKGLRRFNRFQAASRFPASRRTGIGAVLLRIRRGIVTASSR